MKKFWIIAILFTFLAAGVWGQTSYTWEGVSGTPGDWNDPLNWIPNTSFPGAVSGDLVTISGTATITINTALANDLADFSTTGAVNLTGSITTATLSVSAGTLTLTSINVTGNATISAGITTSGNQTYNGAVTLGNSVIAFTGGGTGTSTVRFASTVAGSGAASAINVVTAGARFDGAVSGNIASVTVEGPSAINANITTTGSQTYTGTVTLGGATPRILTTGGTAPVIVGVMNGGVVGLTIYANAATLNGTSSAVGAVIINGTATFQTNTLSAASVSVTGTSVINAGITTSGNQTYTGAVTLGNSVIAFTGGGTGTSTVRFASTVAGSGAASAINVVTAGAQFDGAVSGNIASVTIAGPSAINASITTTGNQTYTGAVTLSNSVIAFTGGGTGTSTVRFSSTVAGSGATSLINVVASGAQFDGAVSGNIASVTVAGPSAINAGITTSANQTYTGAITIGNASVTLTSTAGNLLINGVNTGVNPRNRLEVIAYNTITLNGTIRVPGSGIEGASAAAVYIRARTLEGSATIDLDTGTGEVCANIDTFNFTGTVTGNRIHFHGNNTNNIEFNINGKHLVYRNGTDPGGLVVGTYVYVRADSLATGSTPLFNVASGFNAYIIEVTDADVKNPQFNVAGSGLIEFRGTYSSDGTISLSSGSNRVRFDNDTVTTNPVTISLSASAFTIPAGVNLELSGGTGAQRASISAAGISLGGTVNGIAAYANNIYLSTSGSYTISVSGNAGNLFQLGNIEVQSGAAALYGVLFNGTVGARSYTQTGTGSTRFVDAVTIAGNGTYPMGNFTFAGTTLLASSTIGSAGNRIGNLTVNPASTATFSGAVYCGIFAFIGTALNINNTLDTSGTVTVTNSGTFTTIAAGAINSAGAFLQNGAGGNTIAGNITIPATTGNLAAGIGITFSNLVTVSGAPVFNTNGRGDIYLNGNAAGDVVVSAIADTTLDLRAAGRDIVFGRLTPEPASLKVDMTTTGNLIVAAANVTTANSAPLIIGAGTPGMPPTLPIVNATNLTINGSVTNFNPKNTLTVWGITTNNGTINAAQTTASTTIEFYGHYNGASGVLNGSQDAVNRYIRFGGNAHLGTFIHSSDVIVFSGAGGTSHDLSQNSATVSLPAIALNRVEIEDGNIVELTSNVVQNSGNQAAAPGISDRILLLNESSVLDTGSFRWFMGRDTPPSGLPSVVPAFGNGFYGYYGDVVINDGAVLITQDFYTVQNTGTLNISAPYHRVIIPSAAGEMATIRASGNVYLGESFVGDPIINSTLEMNSAADKVLAVRNNTLNEPQVNIGHFIANGITSIKSNIIFNGNVTIKDDKKLNGGNAKIHVLPQHQASTGNVWDQEDTGEFGHTPQDTSTVEFGTNAAYSGHKYIIKGNTTWYNFVCYEPLADLLFSNYPHSHTFNRGINIEPRKVDGSLDTDPAHMILLSRLENDITKGNPAPDGTLGPDGFPLIIPIGKTPPYFPPDDVNPGFWYFILPPGSDLKINYVFLYFCWSKNRIPQPSATSEMLAIAIEYVYLTGSGGSSLTPHYELGDPRTQSINPEDPLNAHQHSYYNRNWFVADYFFYSFTEDSDGNGKIDRIRVQAGFELNGDFGSGANAFKVSVPGYDVKGYDPVNVITGSDLDLDSIFIYLKENSEPDTGKTLRWRITNNKTLVDAATKSVLMNNKQEEPYYITDDMAPPRINYAFTLPEHDELFFQLSEPVDPGFTLDLSGTRNDLGRGEYLVQGITSYSLGALAGGSQYFELGEVRDYSPYVKDLRSQPVISGKPETYYVYQYPSPKYPKDWDYSEYIEVRGWYAGPGNGDNKPFERVKKDPADSDALPLIREWYDGTIITNPMIGNKMYPWTNGINSQVENDYGKGKHRVTDLLISIPPKMITENTYFVWPLWAKYADRIDLGIDDLGTTTNPGYGYLGQGSNPFTDNDIIWDFTGKRFLEKDKIEMQSRLNDALTVSGLNLVYAFGVSERYKVQSRPLPLYSSPGLWHPWLFLSPLLPLPSVPPLAYMRPQIFFNMVPEFLPGGSYDHPPMVDQGSGLYNHTFLESVIPGDTNIEFYFRLDTDPDKPLAGRLDVAPGAVVPADWYRRVKPFSFGIHGVTRQRSGVTILNNVINSEKKENVFLDYHLGKSGRVTIQVFTMDGNLIKVLENRNQTASDRYYRVSWNGTNNAGRPVARGMYFIRIVGPDIDEIRKVMVVK